MGLAAVDVGYGFVKGVANGKRTLFPSAVEPTTIRGDLARALGVSAPGHHLSVVSVPGGPENVEGRWLVGEAALLSGGVRGWDAAASRRSGYEILILAALALLGEPRTDLAAGLPLSVWLSGKERLALREKLEGLEAWVSVDDADPVLVSVERVWVLPQAAGAFAKFCSSPEGKGVAGSWVGVVDIGYRTTDYLLLAPGKNGVSVPDESRSGSMDEGVGKALEKASREASLRSGSIPGSAEAILEALLLHSPDGVSRIQHEAAEVWTRETGLLAERISSRIRRVWGDILDHMAAVILAGGGGVLLARSLSSLLPNVRLCGEAIFANAEGFLSLLSPKAERV